ncbi:hypothetical protein ABWH92_08795 [Ahrensia marina]|uniref:antibiotic biosynthesis monooxygenase family protein n=1 Tax=Ahrensia marina TaxID=1514904 RepID=UPI0035D0A661
MKEGASEIYVSITGLKLRSPLQAPLFSWHAMRSFSQASSAPGNLSTDARKVDGIHHTLTVWTSREAMLTYLRSAAHLKAMKAFKSIGTGKVHGYHSKNTPSWAEALAIWRENSRAV